MEENKTKQLPPRNFSEIEIMILPGPRERRVAELLAVEGLCTAGSVPGCGEEGLLRGGGRAGGFERVTSSQLSPIKSPVLLE